MIKESYSFAVVPLRFYRLNLGISLAARDEMKFTRLISSEEDHICLKEQEKPAEKL